MKWLWGRLKGDGRWVGAVLVIGGDADPDRIGAPEKKGTKQTGSELLIFHGNLPYARS